MYIIRSETPLGNTESGHASTIACGLGLPDGVAIVDLKFLDDKSLLILCAQKGKSRL